MRCIFYILLFILAAFDRGVDDQPGEGGIDHIRRGVGRMGGWVDFVMFAILAEVSAGLNSLLQIKINKKRIIQNAQQKQKQNDFSLQSMINCIN